MKGGGNWVLTLIIIVSFSLFVCQQDGCPCAPRTSSSLARRRTKGVEPSRVRGLEAPPHLHTAQLHRGGYPCGLAASKSFSPLAPLSANAPWSPRKATVGSTAVRHRDVEQPRRLTLDNASKRGLQAIANCLTAHPHLPLVCASRGALTL